MALLVILVVLAAVLFLALAWPQLCKALTRPRVCSQCAYPLELLTEQLDDSWGWLSGERIYRCPACGDIRREAIAQVFGEGILP